MSETYDAAMEAFQEGVQPEEPAVPSTESVDSEAPASKDIDLSGLSEEQQIFLRAREREMQADYTRKTQELAEQRREAEQAVQFLDALNSDPDFAYQVLSQLQQSLATEGYAVAPEPQYEADEYGQYQEPDPYQQELTELMSWRDQMEQQWYEANLSAQLDRQISTIQSQHPDWTESDLQNIIDLGYATNGDLMKAADQYQAMNDAILARYIERKGQVNTPAPLPSGQGSTPPTPPSDDKALRSAAEEYIRQSLQ